MLVYLENWDDSLGVRIPSNLVEELDLSQESVVNIVREGDHLSIYPQYNWSTSDAISDDNKYE